MVRAGVVVPPEHSRVGPGVLRSDALALLREEVLRGERARREGFADLDGIAMLRIRLLSDRVTRRVAWQLADRAQWSDVRPAEYLAVAHIQADVLVTADEALRAGAAAVDIETADVADLRSALG
nr:hypothetical protein [Cellulomonas uda]